MIGNSYIGPYRIPVPVQVQVPEEAQLAESTEKIFQHLNPLWSNIKNQFKLFKDQGSHQYQSPHYSSPHLYSNSNPYQDQYPSYFQHQIPNQLYTPHPDETINFLNYHSPNQEFGLKFGHDSWNFPGHQSYHPFKKLKAKAKKFKGAAVSALTLLAFMFLLHVMQTCLKEHMSAANPTVVISTAGTARENNKDYIYDYTEDDLADEELEPSRSDGQDNTKTKSKKRKISTLTTLKNSSFFHRNPLT